MEYDVNQPTFDGVTALQFALDNDHLEVAEVLLMHQDLANKQLREMDNPEIQEFLQQQAGIVQTLYSKLNMCFRLFYLKFSNL